MRIRGVVFDLDGTLVDTLEDIAAALNHALEERGLAAWPLESFRELVGEGARRLVEKAVPPGAPPGLVDAVLAGFLTRYTERLLEATRPYPGVLEVLDALRQRGLTVAVLSNKPDALTRRVVEGLLGAERFDQVAGQRAGIPRKPDPAGALRIADATGIPPGEWLYVGDTRTDMETAVRAGMVPVGVLWGYRGAEELRATGARRLVASPEELLEVLGPAPLEAIPAPLPPPEQVTPATERLPALDRVRGLAMLGIIPANLPSFALPEAGREVPGYVSSSPLEQLAVAVQSALIDQKFITTFAFLFGLGLELQAGRAARAGRSFPATHAVRLAILAAIGMCHALLVWHGDILFTYALLGYPLLLLRLLPTPWVAVVCVACLSFSVPIMAGVRGFEGSSPPPRLERDLQTAPPTAGDPFERAFSGPTQLRVYRDGTWREQVVHRIHLWIPMTFVVFLIYSWRLVGLFLLGVLVERLGLFRDPDRWRAVWIGILAAGFALGLPLEAWRAWLLLDEGLAVPVRVAVGAMHEVSSLLLAGGYCAAIVLLLGTGAGRLLTAPLGWVGRMALSAYLLESALGSAVFYSWGLGLFASLSRAQLLALSAVEAAAVVLVCRAWLQWFRMGPVEWAWRSAALGQLQPLRPRGGT